MRCGQYQRVTTNHPPSAGRNRRRAEGWLGLQTGELTLELLHVAEVPIDRGEADVGDAIEVPQTAERELSDPRGLELATGRFDLRGDAVDDGLDARGLNRSLVRRPQQPSQQLLAVERIAAAVALSHVQLTTLVSLERREATTAILAGAATPDGGAVRRLATLQDTGLIGCAVGAEHTLSVSSGSGGYLPETLDLALSRILGGFGPHPAAKWENRDPPSRRRKIGGGNPVACAQPTTRPEGRETITREELFDSFSS